MCSEITTNSLCRVCGLQQEDFPWGKDGKTPTFDICNCCGVEFGYEDITVESTSRFRDAWLANGAHWFKPKNKPLDWNPSAQLAKIGLNNI